MSRSGLGPHRQGRSGVTLLEVCVALAVLAVLGSLAVPALAQRMARERLVLAAESLVADLTEARFQAVRQAATVTLLAQPGPAWRWQVQGLSARALSTNGANGGSLSPTLHSAHPGVRMTQGNAVQLLGDGTARAATVAVFESTHGDRLQVDLLTLGRSRICNRSDSAVGARARTGDFQRYTLC